jgi:hypothetical protein
MVIWTVAFGHDTQVHVTWLTRENFSTHNAFSSIALVYYSMTGHVIYNHSWNQNKPTNFCEFGLLKMYTNPELRIILFTP